jgi:FtsP/CotA-like multicopper oxidase with cupredoxin domain
VKCNSGDRVLLRFVNLAYIEQTMRLSGIKMRVVGRDATLLRGRDGTDLSYETDSVLIGAGESADAIFVAPDVTSETTFLLYSRNYSHLSNAGSAGYGGQMTEVRVSPSGVPPQLAPNT